MLLTRFAFCKYVFNLCKENIQYIQLPNITKMRAAKPKKLSNIFLTPERHENGVKYSSWMIKKVGNLLECAYICKDPIFTVLTQGAHVESMSVFTDFNSHLIIVHGNHTVQKDQNPNNGSR